MRHRVVMVWSPRVDFNLHEDPAQPMSPDEARAWLNLRDHQWAAGYVRAVHAAIGKPMVRVDVPAMSLTC